MTTLTLVIFVMAGLLLLSWVLLNLKTSRKDGELIRRVHPYRRLMGYIMQGRNESIVFYDCYVRAEQLLAYLEQVRTRFEADVTHCLVAAAGIALAEVPSMNHFVVGRRLYHRRVRVITFSMKRKRLNREAKIAMVKMTMQDGETFEQLCARINGHIQQQLSQVRTHTDREYDLFSLVPRPVLNLAVRLCRWLDYHNVLPEAFTRHDGMYTSMCIANLGSLGMQPAFHHLYEWGNCPLFMMAGKIEDKPGVEDGKVVPQKVLHIRWSYDERIDDGLNARFGIDAVKRALETPFTSFGCLAEDGHDAVPLRLLPLERGGDGVGTSAAA